MANQKQQKMKSNTVMTCTAPQGGSLGIPPIVSFVGRSNCGKTTLLEKLIPALAQRGYRIAVVKHTHHREVETDIPGTDSRRLWDAGADHVAFVTPNRVVHTHRYNVEPSLAEALRGIHDVDIVLMEGYKAAGTSARSFDKLRMTKVTDARPVPKIEVVRSACDPKPIPGLEGRIAYITDIPDLSETLPCFRFTDLEGLMNFIEKHIIEAQAAI
jgi:molybdopterin-guanine dinucleotide biosynthesis protein B